MSRLLSVVGALSVATVLLAGVAGAEVKPAQTAAAAARIDGFLIGTRALKADFKARILDAERLPISESSGLLWIKRPGRFRWEYREPEAFLLLADGEQLWTYEADLESATVTPLGEAVPGSPALLLGGDEDWREAFELIGSYKTGDIEWVELRSREAAAEFSLIRLGFEKESVRYMEWIDQLEQTTQIELHDEQVNPELDNGLFEFTPPEGVEVIGRD